MNRRSFLRRSGALALPFSVGFPGVSTAAASAMEALINPDSDRVLVLVQLIGGNDGLNTLVPLDQLSALHQVRAGLVLPESSLLKLPTAGELGFHPALTGFHDQFADGRLSIVQSVGYPNQNRSHFRSTDIWTTGSASGQALTTGWMGRYLETENPGYPEGYPNADRPHPLAVTMGNAASETCQGRLTNLGQAVSNPANLTLLAPGGDTPLPDDRYGTEVAYLRTAMQQTNVYGTIIQDAYQIGQNSLDYPQTGLANQLRNVARLIDGGLQTQVYIVSLGGFDTHSDQVVAGEPTTGNHAGLLKVLGDALRSFQLDLDALGHADRVMGMTFSEFGRRIRDNASGGSDHGDAAPLFLFGNCTAGTILGDNPTIDPDVDVQTAVPMQYDFRDVYGSVLVDWFGSCAADVKRLLYPDFKYLPVAGGCKVPGYILDFLANGFDREIRVKWTSDGDAHCRGFYVERSADGTNFRPLGYQPRIGHEYRHDDADVRLDVLYYYRLRIMNHDGSSDYGPVVTARLRGSALAPWSVGHPYPNPARERVAITVHAAQEAWLHYSLGDSAGRVLMSNRQLLGGGRDHRLSVELGPLPAGQYFLNFSVGGERFSRPLTIR